MQGSLDLGYMWVSRSPINDLVLFCYQSGCSAECMNNHLKEFTGKLQTDGYNAYEQLGERNTIILFGCWAHARQYFDKAKDTEPKIANHVLRKIQLLYEVEAHCRDGDIMGDERKLIRQQKSKPISEEIKTYLD